MPLVGDCTLGNEITDGRRYDERINRAVEPAVSSGFEPVEEQHEFRHLQVVELRCYDKGAFLVLLLAQLVLASAIHCEVGKLWNKPGKRCVLSVFELQCDQCRVFPEETCVVVSANLHLVAWRILLAEPDKLIVPIGCLQGVLRLLRLLLQLFVLLHYLSYCFHDCNCYLSCSMLRASLTFPMLAVARTSS